MLHKLTIQEEEKMQNRQECTKKRESCFIIESAERKFSAHHYTLSVCS